MLTYFSIGFSGYPIFYYGGGTEYLHQPSIGYLLSFFPVVVLLSSFAWKNKDFEKYLFNTRYIYLISIVALLLIHITGIITAFIMLKGTVSFSDIIEVYLAIPLLSQFLLIAVVSILATNLNRLKYYILSKYKKFLDVVFKTSTKRRRLARK